MNDIWTDAIALSCMCGLGAIAMFGIEKGMISLHKSRGTSPTTKFDNPGYYRSAMFMFQFLIVYIIGEANVHSLR